MFQKYVFRKIYSKMCKKIMNMTSNVSMIIKKKVMRWRNNYNSENLLVNNHICEEADVFKYFGSITQSLTQMKMKIF